MTEHITSQTAGAAQYFMESLRQGRFAFDDLDVVIDAAISPDETTAQLGTHVLFVYIVETLSDTFLVEDRKSLEKILAHLISRLRLLPRAEEFDKKLAEWGLNSETDLLARIERHPPEKKFDAGALGLIKKIFIPSRVTLGADVLLNGLVMERMKVQFPEAEIIFLGSEKNGSILKGEQSRVRVLPLHYSRRGALLDRFLNWLEIVRLLEEEVAGLAPEEDYIMINTDSRLLQSGLLPVFPPETEHVRYFCWLPSVRREAWNGSSQAEDLRQWLDFVFGSGFQGESLFPSLHLKTEDRTFAGNVFGLLDSSTNPYIVSMSFGVGGNQEKRVKNEVEAVSVFEMQLILKLLAEGVTIVLDRGFGVEESEQADAIILAVREHGYAVVEVAEVEEDRDRPVPVEPVKTGQVRLIVFRGSINKFAALIERSDSYIGYDSLGQHLAAAMGRDVITVFAGYHSLLFPERWLPLGKGNIRLIKAQSGPFSVQRQQELVEEVISVFIGFLSGF